MKVSFDGLVVDANEISPLPIRPRGRPHEKQFADKHGGLIAVENVTTGVGSDPQRPCVQITVGHREFGWSSTIVEPEIAEAVGKELIAAAKKAKP